MSFFPIFINLRPSPFGGIFCNSLIDGSFNFRFQVIADLQKSDVWRIFGRERGFLEKKDDYRFSSSGCNKIKSAL